MLFWVAKISILSFLLIFLIHYLYSFFLQNLTTPKIKDLVNRPSEQYESIMTSLNKKTTQSNKKTISETSEMKDELKNFLAKEMVNKDDTPAFSNNQGSQGNLIFSNF